MNQQDSLKNIFCLMGPTASGKTQLAVELVQRFPFDIISVDSAMVYRGMDIGTAKPTADILKIAPHQLIDIRDPRETYSAGEFCEDAARLIQSTFNAGRMPLLVGGTMMYFKALQHGLGSLPKADADIRQALQTRAEKNGWESLHDELKQIDPAAAKRIQPHDAQRIQRALEVFHLTGKPISAAQKENIAFLSNAKFVNLALIPQDRRLLHQRIATRFDEMLAQGFIAEVEKLKACKNLHADLPALRAVGYREAWMYLSGNLSYDEMREKSIIATRQLAKRQLTWLRTWQPIFSFPVESKDTLSAVCQRVTAFSR